MKIAYLLHFCNDKLHLVRIARLGSGAGNDRVELVIKSSTIQVLVLVEFVP